MKWQLGVTEYVHQIRERLAVAHRDPEWIKMVEMRVPIDDGLLRMRARLAFSHPGVEVQ